MRIPDPRAIHFKRWLAYEPPCELDLKIPCRWPGTVIKPLLLPRKLVFFPPTGGAMVLVPCRMQIRHVSA